MSSNVWDQIGKKSFGTKFAPPYANIFMTGLEIFIA